MDTNIKKSMIGEMGLSDQGKCQRTTKDALIGDFAVLKTYSEAALTLFLQCIITISDAITHWTGDHGASSCCF